MTATADNASEHGSFNCICQVVVWYPYAAVSNMWFLWPMQVSLPDSVSVSSAILRGSRSWLMRMRRIVVRVRCVASNLALVLAMPANNAAELCECSWGRSTLQTWRYWRRSWKVKTREFAAWKKSCDHWGPLMAHPTAQMPRASTDSFSHPLYNISMRNWCV